jgi:hypothetical protein
VRSAKKASNEAMPVKKQKAATGLRGKSKNSPIIHTELATIHQHTAEL